MEQAKRIERLTKTIKSCGTNDVLDVSDLDIRWTFWDDNISKRTDDNGFVLTVDAVKLSDGVLNVVWGDGCEVTFDSLDEDVYGDGYNCAEFIFGEIEEAKQNGDIVLHTYYQPEKSEVFMEREGDTEVQLEELCSFDVFETEADAYEYAERRGYSRDEIVVKEYHDDDIEDFRVLDVFGECWYSKQTPVTEQTKIDLAFDSILSIYQREDVCIGDLLATINCADYGLNMEEAFILNMRLRNYIDGDEFYRQCEDGDMEQFNTETEWFN